MNNENKIEDNNKKNNIPRPKKKFLSFSKKNPFERHPSANGLMIKDDNDISKKCDKDLNFICTVVNEENELNSEEQNKEGKRNSCVFEFKIQKIEEKLFQDEVFYTKNENVENNNNKSSKSEKKIFPNNHQLYEFSEGDKKLDKEITDAIQKGEKEDNIISKIKSKV
jgi:hypothetical protein